MDRWVGAQGWPKVAYFSETCPLCDVPSENSPPKPKIVFFDFDYQTCSIRRGFEQLSSWIVWRVIGLLILQEKWRTRDLNGFNQVIIIRINRTQNQMHCNNATACKHVARHMVSLKSYFLLGWRISLGLGFLCFLHFNDIGCLPQQNTFLLPAVTNHAARCDKAINFKKALLAFFCKLSKWNVLIGKNNCAVLRNTLT